MAAEVLPEQPGRALAHAIPAPFPDWDRRGVAYCGYPAEYLGAMPDIDWTDVQPDTRCPHCAADHAADLDSRASGAG